MIKGWFFGWDLAPSLVAKGPEPLLYLVMLTQRLRCLVNGQAPEQLGALTSRGTEHRLRAEPSLVRGQGGLVLPNFICKFALVSSSATQSCPTLCDPMDCSMPGFPVHHQLPGLAQTHVDRVGDAIQPAHPLSSPSSPAFNLSQHQGLSQRVSSSHQVAKV